MRTQVIQLISGLGCLFWFKICFIQTVNMLIFMLLFPSFSSRFSVIYCLIIFRVPYHKSKQWNLNKMSRLFVRVPRLVFSETVWHNIFGAVIGVIHLSLLIDSILKFGFTFFYMSCYSMRKLLKLDVIEIYKVHPQRKVSIYQGNKLPNQNCKVPFQYDNRVTGLKPLKFYMKINMKQRSTKCVK